MNSVGLPARVGYAFAALVAVGVAAFYASMWLLPKVLSNAADDDDGYAIFRTAVGIALALGFSAALVGLTLPWKRRRRRSGRGRRIAISSVFVVGLSMAFASQQHSLVLDLLFAVWLAYAFAYTYVRYGLLDKPRTGSAGESAAAASAE
jgi:uncharacterized membrane protein YfcA